jgi:hypothetical protein
MRGGQPAMAVLHLLATTASAVTPSPDPVLSIVAAARYGSRGVGSRPWLRKELCFASVQNWAAASRCQRRQRTC